MASREEAVTQGDELGSTKRLLLLKVSVCDVPHSARCVCLYRRDVRGMESFMTNSRVFEESPSRGRAPTQDPFSFYQPDNLYHHVDSGADIYLLKSDRGAPKLIHDCNQPFAGLSRLLKYLGATRSDLSCLSAA
jgi:hypothetical protein